jgi:hypothetical protein
MAGISGSRQKLAVLDTNILFHLAEQYAPAHNLVLRLVRSGMMPIVVPTVVQELANAVDEGDTAKKRAIAAEALSSMLQWGIQPTSLKPVGFGICDVAANVIANRHLLPEEERNDAYILIESAFWEASMLLTWDRHLLEASQEGLNDVLRSFDLSPVQILDPKAILGY